MIANFAAALRLLRTQPRLPKRLFLRVSSLLIMAGLLSGCGIIEVSQKIFEVLKDPDVPVGDAMSVPTNLDLIIVAEDYSNTNEEGQSVPLDVFFYQLEDAVLFAQLDYEELVDAPDKTLKGSYVDHEEFTVEPGKSVLKNEFELDGKTNFIAIVAGYSDLEEVDWSSIKKIKPEGEEYHVVTVLQPEGVSIELHR